MTEAGLAAAGSGTDAPARGDARRTAAKADPPRGFATGESQGREELRGAPLRAAPRPSRLGAPVRSLRGVGPRLAAAAEGLGLVSLGDLLLHVPHTYRDRTELTEVGELRIGEEGTVLVEVKGARLRHTRRRN